MPRPVCKSLDLVITHRQGIEIGYRPPRRGVWLDRGERHKFFERLVQLVNGTPSTLGHTQEQTREHNCRQDSRTHTSVTRIAAMSKNGSTGNDYLSYVISSTEAKKRSSPNIS